MRRYLLTLALLLGVAQMPAHAGSGLLDTILLERPTTCVGNTSAGVTLGTVTATSAVTTLGAESCNATMSPTLRLSLPVVAYTSLYGTMYLSAELGYSGEAGDFSFELQQFNILPITSNCAAASMDQELTLNIPKLNVKDTNGETSVYWVKLGFAPGRDGRLLFRIVAHGAYTAAQAAQQ